MQHIAPPARRTTSCAASCSADGTGLSFFFVMSSSVASVTVSFPLNTRLSEQGREHRLDPQTPSDLRPVPLWSGQPPMPLRAAPYRREKCAVLVHIENAPLPLAIGCLPWWAASPSPTRSCP